jgi:hypothetical protein
LTIEATPDTREQKSDVALKVRLPSTDVINALPKALSAHSNPQRTYASAWLHLDEIRDSWELVDAAPNA